jgi:hypothetical protein
MSCAQVLDKMAVRMGGGHNHRCVCERVCVCVCVCFCVCFYVCLYVRVVLVGLVVILENEAYF